MRTLTLLCSMVLVAATTCVVNAQRITVTWAGNGFAGYNTDDKPGYCTQVNAPYDVLMDNAHNVYFSDRGNDRIRKVSARTGMISTIAGGGTSNADGIPATDAMIHPYYMCRDAANNIYFTTDNKVRKIDGATGIITTVAGGVSPVYAGDGGPAIAASLSGPLGICIDAANNLYVVDAGNYRIRKIDGTTGIISTIAGIGTAGYTGEGGPAIAAQISMPRAIAVNAGGDVFFSDQGAARVRKITAATGIISLYAGTGAMASGDGGPAILAGIGSIYGIVVDGSGDVIIDDESCACRKINNTTGIINRIAGDLVAEGYNGDGFNSMLTWFNRPFGLCIDENGNIMVAENFNNRIRKVIQVTAAPQFAYGKGQFINPCPSAAMNINNQMAIADMDSAQTETWTVLAGPTQGSLSGFPYTRPSTGSGTLTTPTGLQYMPASSFSGMDSFVVRVTDGASADTVTVYVRVQVPNPGTISGTNNVCVSSSIVLAASIGGGSWSGTNGHTSVSAAGLIAGVSAGVDTVVYTITEGCPMSTRYEVTVKPLPAIGVITGPDTVCVGAPMTFTNSIAGGSWAATPAATVGATSGVVTGITYGPAVVSYTTTNASCTSRVSKSIRVHAPTSALAGTSIVCVGSTITMNNSEAGGTWALSNTSATITPFTAASSLISGVSYGQDTVIYTNTNMCGTGSVTKVVSVNTLPAAATVTGSSEVCTGSTMTLTGSVAGGTWTAWNTNATVGYTNGVVTGALTGVDSIFYWITGSGASASCRAKTSVFINIATTPVAGTISGTATVCEGAVAGLTSTAAGGVWTATNPGATVSSTGDVTGVSSGLDTLIYTVTNSCGTATTSHVVDVLPLPVPGTISGPSIICMESGALLSSTIAGGDWTSTTGNTTIATSGTVSGVATGSDIIVYTVTNSCGTASASYPVTVKAIPDAGTISGSTTVMPGGTTLLSTTAIAGGIWSSSNTAIALVSTTGDVSGVAPGVATISYTLSNECGTGTAHFDVTVVDNTGTNNLATNIGDISVAPNPTKSNFAINISAAITEAATVVVSDVTGARVATFTGSTNQAIPASLNVAAGVYMLTISTAHGNASHKLVVQ